MGWTRRRISPEEQAAVQEAREELAPGASLISREEIKREPASSQGLERAVVSGRFILRAFCAPGSGRPYASTDSPRAYGCGRLALFSPTPSLSKETGTE